MHVVVDNFRKIFVLVAYRKIVKGQEVAIFFFERV